MTSDPYSERVRALFAAPQHAGDLEEELPGWTITVGPREAAHIPGFLKEKS